MPAGHVHHVANDTVDTALSVHVYSPPLSTMTDYEVSAENLVLRSVRPVDGAPSA
jgi:hypothetical protein